MKISLKLYKFDALLLKTHPNIIKNKLALRFRLFFLMLFWHLLAECMLIKNQKMTHEPNKVATQMYPINCYTREQKQN